MKNSNLWIVEKYADIFLKLISIIILVGFIGNVYFNMSYFRTLGISWEYLLELSDYYEGATSAIFLNMCFFVVVIISFICCLGIKGSLQDLSSLQEQTPSVKHKLLYISSILKFFVFLLILLFVVNSLAIKSLLFGGLIVAFLWNYKQTFSRNWKLIIIFFVVGYWGVMVVLGESSVYQGANKSLFTRPVISSKPSFAMISGRCFFVQRCISKGCIVREGEKFLFYKWEHIDYLYYSANSIQQKLLES